MHATEPLPLPLPLPLSLLLLPLSLPLPSRPRYEVIPGTEAIRAHVLHDQREEDAARLMPGSGAFFWRPETGQPCRGAVLAFHGFSASCYQWWEIGDFLTRHGFCFYAPRLPGHGRVRDGTEHVDDVPLASDSGRYAASARAAWADLEALRSQRPALPMILLGLSGGCVSVFSLLSEHAHQVAATSLFSPYVGLPSASSESLFRGLDLASDSAARQLDRLGIPIGWGREHARQAAIWRRPGFSKFRAAHAYALHRAKQRALHDWLASGECCRPRLQMFVSPTDTVIDPGAAIALFRRAGGRSRNLHVMRTAMPTAHAMLTSMENPNETSRAYLRTVLLAFLEIWISSSGISLT